MSAPTTMDPVRMRAEAGTITAALKLLAHPDRMLLLCTLSQREMCVGELEEALDLHQPSLSQQLGVLRNEGVVTTRKDGKQVYYKAADPAVTQVLGALYRTYCSKE
jgi:ArsR family transcriptional regulator